MKVPCRRFTLGALLVLLAAPSFVRAQEGDCWDFSRHVYLTVPDLVYEGQRDSLFHLVQDWQDQCGFSEPALRLTILSAIWDEAFDESIYDIGILDALIWRYDEGRRRNVSGEVDPDWAPGGIASPADFAFGIEDFDAFTTDFADQLLPHMPDDSLERFFCLFYSGRQDQAWAMLEGHALTGTDLRWYHQRELSLLRKPVPRQILAFYGGQYVPRGNALYFGDHASFAVSLGLRKDRLLLRGLVELRPGRARYPYYVDHEGVTGTSDRFNNLLLGVEVGREIISWHRHRVDVFGGIAYDSISPFQDEDFELWTISLLYGVGYRVELGQSRRWLLGFDYRGERAGGRNSDGVDLDGGSTTWRLSLGFVLGQDRGNRLTGLGR